MLSLRYQFPTLPFKARKAESVNGFVARPGRLSTASSPPSIPTPVAGAARGPAPQLRPAASCAAHLRGPSPKRHGHALRRPPWAHADAHRCAWAGVIEAPRRARRHRLVGAAGEAGRAWWRYESCFKDYGAAMAVVGRIAEVLPVHLRQVARLGASERAGQVNSLPCIDAQSVRPGMAMFADDGGYDVVESVERSPSTRPSTTSTWSRRTTSSRTAWSPTTRSTVPRSRHPQHPRLRGRLSRRARRPARAELPLHADHPQRGERGRRQQPRAQVEVAVDRDRRGRPIKVRELRRTSTRRRATSSRRSSGSSTRGSRAPRSPSSTGRTRSRGCSRTCSCAPRSPTR